MQYINDWVMLGLALGLLCGGLVAASKLGSLAACFLTASAWLGFRMADRLWKIAVVELRAADARLDLAFWIPITYGALFLILFVPMLLGLAWLRPKKDFELPGVIEHLVAACGGMATAFLLLLAFTQAQVMHPLAPERIPNTLLAVRPLLSALGQKRVAPTAPPTGTPADKPTQALVAPGLR